MAKNRLSFAAAVKDWADRTEAKMTEVFRQSASEVLREMNRPVGEGGNMPVDTNFLRDSRLVGLNIEMPLANRAHPGKGAFAPQPGVDLIIAGAGIGDTIVAGYTANYAGHVNNGTSRMAPRQFVEKAAQQWPTIVGNVIARLKND